MLKKLKEIQKQLSDNGEYKGVEVIKEHWVDGGGAPVYLEDVIQILENDAKAWQCEQCGATMGIDFDICHICKAYRKQ